jgi:CheY-like chemotaxis protein
MSEPIRIVLVDDDDGIAQLLAVNFSLDPRFELVGRGRDGREAVPLYRRHRPDAVLMDLNMPAMDGVEATRAVLAADPDACVIAFTATDDPRDAVAAEEAGVVAVLTKPFDPLAFLDAVERHAARCASHAA